MYLHIMHTNIERRGGWYSSEALEERLVFQGKQAHFREDQTIHITFYLPFFLPCVYTFSIFSIIFPCFSV